METWSEALKNDKHSHSEAISKRLKRLNIVALQVPKQYGYDVFETEILIRQGEISPGTFDMTERIEML